MQKVVGILISPVGIADELSSLTQKIKKDGQGSILFDNNPASLVETLLDVLKSKSDG